jgi:4-hydroxythreonine-4-phosphate dehydrogenase
MQPLALTLGEPAGIGPDLSLALWTQREALGVPPFLLLGDPAFLEARARSLGLAVKIAVSNAEQAVSTFATALPVMPLGVEVTALPGKPDATSAPAAREAIERAVALVQAGKASAVVTNPIAKSVMRAAGFEFPGHTEFLSHLAARAGGAPPRPVMLIWSEELAVVPVTIHVPLADVPRLLTANLIVETGRIVAREFATRFGVAHPRLAVCGLNPHAGEGGMLGRQDEEIIRPRSSGCNRKGSMRAGPTPPTRFSMPMRGAGTMSCLACITIRF